MNRKTRLILAVAVLSVSACAASAPKINTPAKLPIPAGLVPGKIVSEPQNMLPLPEPKMDSCGAGELASLIGKPRSQIPAPVYPDRRRVACTTCPMTPDVRADRLTILFDADTGIVKELKCG